jgi:hypothetical protein
MPDTPDILLSKVNQITMSDVSISTATSGERAEWSWCLGDVCLLCANHFGIRIPILNSIHKVLLFFCFIV